MREGSLTAASEEQSQAIGNIAVVMQEIDQFTCASSELSKESHNYSLNLNDQVKELEMAMTSLTEFVHGKKANTL